MAEMAATLPTADLSSRRTCSPAPVASRCRDPGAWRVANRLSSSWFSRCNT